ncbi:MAG: DUF1566 domain-containing protein [Campylobacterales bacterium]|nr:DUF1566 domain-containing protein [Campylobacterales bacterium]
MRKLLLSLGVLFVTSISATELIKDKSTSLLWQDNIDSKELQINYYKAQDYCAKLVVGSQKDFRIPTLTELHTLVDYKHFKPAMIEGFTSVANEVYWSSTPFVDDADRMWAINFRDGKTDIIVKSYDRRVRCVKSTKQ